MAVTVYAASEADWPYCGEMMKKHILRAPQTDRYLLNVPTELEDLTDYGDSYAAGQATSTVADIIEPFDATNIDLDTTVELTNVTRPGGSLVVGVAGLYLVIVTASWVWSAVGAPTLARRVGVSINGTAGFERSVRLDNDSTGAQQFDDQASFLIRLAIGETVQPRVEDLTGIASDVTTTLEIVKVAP